MSGLLWCLKRISYAEWAFYEHGWDVPHWRDGDIECQDFAETWAIHLGY